MPRLPVLDAPPSSTLQHALAQLAASIEGEVRLSHHDRMLYATDASLYQVEPLAVVIPASIADARRALALCAAHRLPILPRGAGTSLAGQTTNHAVIIDFSVACRAIGPVDEANHSIHVEPGVVLDELNEELAARNAHLFFAPDVATSRHANIAGMIGNNSAGAHSILYGRTSEHIRAIDALIVSADAVAHTLHLAPAAALHDARVRAITESVIKVVRENARHIRQRFPTTLRHVDGYNLDIILNQIEAADRAGHDPLEHLNLAKLLVGSEGTLAVTLGAELNLEPAPVAKGLAILSYASLDQAIDAVSAILETKPAAVELLDDMILDLARANSEYRSYADLVPMLDGNTPAAVLYVEYFAIEDRAELDDRFSALRAAQPEVPILIYTDPKQMTAAWKLRKAGEPLLHGLPGIRKPITFVEDTAVAPERLPAFVRAFRAIVENNGTRAAYFAHASVGCLHIRPLLDMRDSQDQQAMLAIAREVAALVKDHAGALSGEHGDGRVRTPLLAEYFGSELMRAFREIKRIFDPLNLLNTGNIVAPASLESIAQRTRIQPTVATEKQTRFPNVDTYFNYSDQHGFAGAVEMCNGAGVCRKKTGATMCPSYMASLDERLSTRGRGNALRLAITGQLRNNSGDSVWNDSETIKTLDTCLSCKACKTECPSNVDIARLKAEYTAQRFRERGGPPISVRLLANVRTLNQLAARAPGLFNRAQRVHLSRFCAHKLFGIAHERSLPEFGESLAKWMLRRAQMQDVNNHKPRAALFQDCFTGFGESHIGRATVRTLEQANYKVFIPQTGCCGRPALSLGALDIARQQIEKTAAQLAPVADDAAAILFCEPSCLSAIKDDWLQLQVKTPRKTLEQIAAKACLAEDYLAREHSDWLRQVGSSTERRQGKIILHTHCHQKSLWGDDTSATALRCAFGDEHIRVLDSGCCGMAGSFGMMEERVELSRAIGELTLLPEVRQAEARDVIAAPGTSCRHQIRDFTDRRALHPIELIAGMLDGEDTL